MLIGRGLFGIGLPVSESIGLLGILGIVRAPPPPFPYPPLGEIGRGAEPPPAGLELPPPFDPVDDGVDPDPLPEPEG